MRKLRESKVVILIICVIVVSLMYFGIRKVIDEYIFKTNSDIISEDGSSKNTDDTSWFTREEGNSGESDGKDWPDNSGQLPEEEFDLVLEESIEGESEENSDRVEGKIYVYITGEVNIPGVVILNDGSRIVDAINAAGGTTSKANISKVNLVYVLGDGMKVNIPNSTDLKNNPDFEYITTNSGDGASDDFYRDTFAEGSSNSNSNSDNVQYHKRTNNIVNINTATQTELETLPGIGPSLALKIINYRKDNGKFFSIDEIKNVSGIGENKFEELKNYITI